MIELEKNALVWGVIGNLGGGKSLSAVAVAVHSIRCGYMVVSNITIDIDKIVTDYNIPWARGLYQKISLDDPTFDPFKLPCGDPRGSGGKKRVLVILDECAEWFDQYTSAKDGRVQRLLSWLRHSSKRSQDVILVVQRQEYLNKSVRILVARWIWVDDLAVYRMPYLKIRFPFMSGYVMQNVFDRAGLKVGSVQFLAKKHYGSFYNTAECLNLDGSTYNFVYEVPPEKQPLYLFVYLLWLASVFALYRSTFFAGAVGPGAPVRPASAVIGN